MGNPRARDFLSTGDRLRHGLDALAAGRASAVANVRCWDDVAAPSSRRPSPPATQPLHRTVVPDMLARLRVTAAVSQTALADRLGMTQSEVSKFERGERTLDVVRLRAWLHALGVGFASFAQILDQELTRLERQT